jgi:hypothetical protein
MKPEPDPPPVVACLLFQFYFEQGLVNPSVRGWGSVEGGREKERSKMLVRRVARFFLVHDTKAVKMCTK